jgi:hypothetical protein
VTAGSRGNLKPAVRSQDGAAPAAVGQTDVTPGHSREQTVFTEPSVQSNPAERRVNHITGMMMERDCLRKMRIMKKK